VPVYDASVVQTVFKKNGLPAPPLSNPIKSDTRRAQHAPGVPLVFVIMCALSSRAQLGEIVPFVHQSTPSNDWWVFHHAALATEIGFGPDDQGSRQLHMCAGAVVAVSRRPAHCRLFDPEDPEGRRQDDRRGARHLEPAAPEAAGLCRHLQGDPGPDGACRAGG
jgi:hypothetical protein